MRRYGRRVRREFLRRFRSRYGRVCIKMGYGIFLAIVVISMICVFLAMYLESVVLISGMMVIFATSVVILVLLENCETYLFDTSVLTDARNMARRLFRRWFPRQARRLNARINPLSAMEVPMVEFPVAQEQGEAASERMDETSLDMLSLESVPLVRSETPITMLARTRIRAKLPLPPEAARHSYHSPSAETSRRELQEALAELQTPPISMPELVHQSRYLSDEDVARPVRDPSLVLDARRLPDSSPHQESRHSTGPRLQSGCPTSVERSDVQVSTLQLRPCSPISPSSQEPAHDPFIMVPPHQESPDEDSLAWAMRLYERSIATETQVPTSPVSPHEDRPNQGRIFTVSPHEDRPDQGPTLPIPPRQETPDDDSLPWAMGVFERIVTETKAPLPVSPHEDRPNQGLTFTVPPHEDRPDQGPTFKVSLRERTLKVSPQKRPPPIHTQVSPHQERLSLDLNLRALPHQERLAQDPIIQARQQRPSRNVSGQVLTPTERPRLQIISEIPPNRPFVMVSSSLPNQRLPVSPVQAEPIRGQRLPVSPQQAEPIRGQRLPVSPLQAEPIRGQRLPISTRHEGPGMIYTPFMDVQQMPQYRPLETVPSQLPGQAPGSQVSLQEAPEENLENLPEQE